MFNPAFIPSVTGNPACNVLFKPFHCSFKFRQQGLRLIDGIEIASDSFILDSASIRVRPAKVKYSLQSKDT
jgi:hypothetical protein